METTTQSSMADADMSITASLAPAATSPPSSSSRRSVPPAGPKLRDSCHACASSKVKCHKEKPTCSRCSKRGIACEYFATRRGGRPNHDRRPTMSTNDAGNSTIMVKQNIAAMNSWFASNSMQSAGFVVSPIAPHPGPSPGATPDTSSANFLPDVCPVDPGLGSLSLGFADLGTTDFDSFFASPISLSDTDFLNQGDFFSSIESASVGNNVQSNATTLLDTFSFMEESLSAPMSISTPRSPPNSLASPMYTENSSDRNGSYKKDLSVPSLPDFESSSSGCCLVKALGLMRGLFPNSSTACSSITSSPRHDSSGSESVPPPPNVQTVITQNRQTVEAIASILRCSCSRDGCLLSILTLAVFKMLRWYAAAAGRSQAAATLAEKVLQTPTKVGSYCLEGEHSAHMAAKLVLSELHRVQRLVNMLSERLKVYSAAASDPSSGNDAAAGSASRGGSETNHPPPFSAAIFDQLGVDLKKQLKALSQDLVEGLRKEC
ncbi:aflatoxin regulatory protein-domain-containing protein [Rhypophila decipiens]|uniref:Aflatoxin regulatory protein-domain-containing protein n=1 Tax=Rhypophila decipiens TaxID=261697 RepID=A0AAN7B310_9PEZI|nr:aflatoxin regulatory protein-domain-containing protein [Rhypophila decipiens]